MNEKNKLVADLEQFETLISNFGPIIGSYYISLIENKVPPDLAYQLTIDWHKIFWDKQFNTKNE